MCGNVSVPFPFGTELGCFARINLYLTCNPGSSPAILQMTEHLVVTDISINEGILRIQKLSDPGDFLGDRSTKLYSFSEESGMLKWAVDNSTCKEAMLNKNEYRCVSARSDCVDVTDDRTSNHVGYRCKCSSGFQGNPYLQDGCTGKFLVYVYLMIRKKYTLFPFSWTWCNLQISTSACNQIYTLAMASVRIAWEVLLALDVRMEQILTELQGNAKHPTLS
jgi:hypothetical protein